MTQVSQLSCRFLKGIISIEARLLEMLFLSISVLFTRARAMGLLLHMVLSGTTLELNWLDLLSSGGPLSLHSQNLLSLTPVFRELHVKCQPCSSNYLTLILRPISLATDPV